MITAMRNGTTKDFTETCWNLLPADKCGWAKVPAAPPVEVEQAVKAERNTGWKPAPSVSTKTSKT